MKSAALKAAFGLILCLTVLKPLGHDIAFIVAFVFQLYVPLWLGYSVRFDSGAIKTDLIGVTWVSALTFSVYALGYYYVQQYWAAHQGYQAHFYPTFSWSLLWGFVINLALVAFPEEVFYRGFLQSRISSIFLVNFLFALGHFVGEYDPVRLLPFFPGLVFSWLVYRSGSIVGAVFYHALCNTFSEWLASSYHWSH
ncbi:MAG: CPBP family intramembrane glutamic endopeptidase [Myxococcaceae bacterium]